MFVRIDNTPRDYAWGSKSAIAELLGHPASGGPEAELWLGAHPGSPSRIVTPSAVGGATDLAEWIARDPVTALGEGTPGAAGAPRLTFLLKVLAAASPLSLQAHPSAEQAREGFARENTAGIALDAPERNYKDPFHKPELIYALSDRFEALCGFRPLADAIADLDRLLDAARAAGQPSDALAAFRRRLAVQTDPEQVLRAAVAWLLGGRGQRGGDADAAAHFGGAGGVSGVGLAGRAAEAASVDPHGERAGSVAGDADATGDVGDTGDADGGQRAGAGAAGDGGGATRGVAGSEGQHPVGAGVQDLVAQTVAAAALVVTGSRGAGDERVGLADAAAGDERLGVADVAAGDKRVGVADGAPGADVLRPFVTVGALESDYPGDPGVVLSLLLHRVTLKQGEALYLPAGNIHAYLAGLGVELMAASDNVLRGGLTPKHIDVPELMRVLHFAPLPVPYLRPERGGDVEVYRTDVPDFQLVRVVAGTDADDTDAAEARVSLAGPAIALCTAGSVRLRGAMSEATLGRGESAYVTPEEASVAVVGDGTVFFATGNL